MHNKTINVNDLNLSNYANYVYDISDKVKYLGVKGKGCIFCGRPYYRCAFNNNSHAIPEFLGNKSLIHYNECDDCNAYFSSTLENHLDTYIKFARTLFTIKGKKKVPAFKSNGLRINSDSTKNHLNIIANDSSCFTIDQENKTLEIKVEKGSYIPLSVYKCFIKMALSIMPIEQIKNYTIVNKWIRNKLKNNNLIDRCYLIHGFVKGHKPLYEKKFCMIFLRKIYLNNSDCDCLFKICFGNLELQIAVPSDKEFEEKCSKNIAWIPSFFGEIKKSIVDLSSDELLKKSEEKIKIKFDEITESSL